MPSVFSPPVYSNSQQHAEAIRKDLVLKEAQDALRQALAEVERLKHQLNKGAVCVSEEERAEGAQGRLVGQTPAIRRVLAQVEKVAPTDSTVLLLGETGTGKELLAAAIHKSSPRRAAPW